MKTEHSLAENFRANLRYYRKQNNLSQEKLSEKLNKNQNYINMIESGKSTPPLDMIDEIARVLNINSILLLSDFGSPESIQNSFKKIYATEIKDELMKRLSLAVDETLKLI
ncbi:MAG: helix-turn-helix transcriptional regulator [Treponema sp.]|nr:helix-turn-helix transcriptional regulator [Candidatus Treponema equifaecale]